MNDFSSDSRTLYSHPILVVDDNHDNLNLIETFLAESGFEILVAQTGKSAIERAKLGQPNLILLDIMMPDINGFELCQTLKNIDSTRNIPIIFMTALSDDKDKIRGFQSGAVDYITKPINKEELLMRVITHLRLYILTENLEAQVAARTHELLESNVQLQQEIEERIMAEETLKKNQIQLQAILDHAPALISIKDLEGNAILVNRSFEVLEGPSPEEFIGKNVFDLFPQDIAEALWQNDLAALKAGKPIMAEEEVVHKDGLLHTYLTIKFPLYEKPNQAFGICAISTDITERKQAEEALRESEARYRDLVETSQGLIWKCDTEGRFTYLNPAWEGTIGYKLDEMLGRKLSEFKTPEIATRDIKAFYRVRDGGSLTNYETIYISKSGDKIYLIFNAQAEYDIAGNMIGTQGTAYDITERKQAEVALRESEDTFRTLVENALAAIIIVNQAGQIVKANRKTETVFGYSINELLGQNLELLIPQHLINKHKDHRTTFFEAGSTRPMGIDLKLFAQHKDKTLFPVEVGLATIHTNKEQLAVAYVIDITERKEAENIRERLISELKAKNSELEQFTYTVSHDLKSPLITIRGFLGYLEQDAIAGNLDTIKSDIAHITNATDKMNQLLDELLELSRIGRLVNQPQLISLNLVVTEALDSVSNINDRNFSIEIMPNLPSVYIDRGRILQVFENLIANAIKFSNHKPKPKIEIGFREDNTETVIYVKDNGIGIESKYHDKIFGLFNQLDQTIEGTGIGLTIVKRIIKTYNGRIWIESEGKDKGSSFCFTLADD